ncbi:hypothetical protein CVT24_007543 [Panaeolus cyanescens]|uniref:Uncharacterized protein n=1 Tax=Panaeolus cyanescens TaxID=181874 RepID=A0A409WL96_9AGAR|nr:hypothetical protein CVT24_007543 [Panaeolus cyanescens]
MTESGILKTPQKKLEARKQYYIRNHEQEKSRARARAQQKRKDETPQEAETRKARHREAASRYRKANRAQLRINEWQRRKRIKLQKEIEADEEEFQRLWALED